MQIEMQMPYMAMKNPEAGKRQGLSSGEGEVGEEGEREMPYMAMKDPETAVVKE